MLCLFSLTDSISFCCLCSPPPPKKNPPLQNSSLMSHLFPVSPLHVLSQRPHFTPFLYLSTVHQPPATMLITPQFFFSIIHHSAISVTPLCCACFLLRCQHFARVCSGCWYEEGGRLLVPNSTTNGCLASSDWHRLGGSRWWCGGGSCRGPDDFIAAVGAQLTEPFAQNVFLLF